MFGKRMKEIRQKKGLSQNDIEKITGIKKGVISVYEQNKSKPGLEAIEKICKALNVSADYLIFGKNSSESERDKLYNSLCDQDKKIVDMILEKAKKGYDTVGNL